VRRDGGEVEHGGHLFLGRHRAAERLGELGEPLLCGGSHAPDVSLPPVSPHADVAIIGGGIIGCALAAFLAEAGARVRLYERDEVAAGASGRNSGLLQHPMDELLTGIYADSEAHYRELGHGFEMPEETVGVLIVGEDPAGLEPTRADLAARFPELDPQALDNPHEAEPALAEDLAGFRIDTGRPVPPAAATHAFAARARHAGAEILEGAAATPATSNGRVTGVRTSGGEEPAGAVVVAAGPWSSALVDPTGAWRPVAPLWGVNVELRLSRPPRHALEESGIKDLMTEGTIGPLFSLVTRGGVSALGSTFLTEQPEPAEIAPGLVERGSRFVPQLAGTQAVSLRACARPISADGRPLLGPLPTEGLFVATGHGPWGVSLGPGSARLVADGVLGKDPAIPPELAASRF
jgi:D-hydroxyproline dehydrogenase subunit beta